MSKNLTVLPKKNRLRKVLWGLAFLILLAWVINQPHQAAAAVRSVLDGLSAFVSGLGG